MSIPKMRTLPEIAKMISALDPETAVTLTALRRMAKKGEIPVTMIASRRLVNFDQVIEILQNPERTAPLTTENTIGVIRPIPERAQYGQVGR